MMTMVRPGPVCVARTPLHRLHPAVVLAGFGAAVLADLVGGPGVVALLTGLALWGLAGARWRPRHLGGLLKPWWTIAVLVLAVHVLTTTSGAPLGHPSWVGLQRGLLALARLAGILMGLALLQSTLEVEDLVAGLTWWLRPLDGRLLDADDLGLMLAVALGTAPRVLSEGRRLQAVIRLRRGGVKKRLWRRIGQRILDQAVVVVPLMEDLARRAETVSLTLRLRRPGPGGTTAGVGMRQGGLLALWVLMLAGLILAPRGLW